MKTVLQLAQDLARAIEQSPQNQAFQAALQKIKTKGASEQILAEFRTRQFQVQALHLSGQAPTEDQARDLQDLYGKLNQDATVQEYLAAEVGMAQLLTEVQQTIGQAFNPKAGGG